MSLTLIICEKNIAARRIAYILSDGNYKRGRIAGIPYYSFNNHIVIGLKGHIMKLDYPEEYSKWNDIAPKNLIDVKPVKKILSPSIARALKEIAKDVKKVIIATDYDREGELIGVEVLELLPKNVEIKRARFSAITPYEIKKAFENLGSVDYNLSKSAEARQYIDLIWGASLTRFISISSNQLGKDFLSVGRVQTPTLALIVEKEKEIKNFIPKPYWIIKLSMQKNGIIFEIKSDKIEDEKEAKKIYEKIKKEGYAIVKKFQKKTIKERPPYPFDTTTFLKDASYLGFSASNAMKMAEELYMNGCISYPRTDNTVYPPLPFDSILKKLEKIMPSDIEEVRKMRRSKPVRGKKIAHDHPPIHPVDACKVDEDHRKIYELIVRRFLATISKDAVIEEKNVEMAVKNHLFKGKGTIIVEKNWRKIYPYYKMKESNIPDMEENEKVKIVTSKLKKDETKPPKRYTQGSLIVEMEKLGLGTKSTRHEIIGKLYRRNYIRGKRISPSPAGVAVTEALKKGAEIITKPDMTAALEKEMGEIAEGKKTFEEVVEESKKILRDAFKILEGRKEIIAKEIKEAMDKQNYFGKCPNCGGNLIMRKSKYGKRFIGCSNYPDCKTTYPLPQKGAVFFEGEYCECGAPIITVIYKGKKWKKCVANCN
ncbi:MAG: DNA topoisomerase I [Thermoplasmata archaeon]|nr:MAG: DNA topoisomerase I [Thermoplasmata archaeon]